MLTEQLLLGDRVARQVFVCEKLEAFVPVIEMELMASSWLPVFTIEKICVALVLPTAAPKVCAEDGKIVTAGPLTACTGLPEMARPPQQPRGLSPELKGDPGISARLPVCGST